MLGGECPSEGQGEEVGEENDRFSSEAEEESEGEEEMENEVCIPREQDVEALLASPAICFEPKGRLVIAALEEQEQELRQVLRPVVGKVLIGIDNCSVRTMKEVQKAFQAARGEVVVMKFSHPVPYDVNPTFLGLTLDGGLIFKAHAKRIKRKMQSRLRVVRALTGTTWGCLNPIMRQLYTSYVQAAADYASGVYTTFCSPSVRREVETAQLSAARLISGCVCSTTADIALVEAGLIPMQLRGQGRAARAYEHYCRLPQENLARRVAEQKAEVVIKLSGCGLRRSWRQEAQSLVKEAGLITQAREPLLYCPPAPPWVETEGIAFNPSLQDPVTRNDPPEVRRKAAERTFAALPPASIICFTDGSVRGPEFIGGSGFTCQVNGKTSQEENVPAGVLCSSYRAELTAIRRFLEWTLSEDWSQVAQLPFPAIRVCTDSQSSINSLAEGPAAQTQPLEGYIWTLLLRVRRELGFTITMQYCPGHAGVTGSDRADELARRASAQPPQCGVPLDQKTAYAAIQRALEARWRKRMYDGQSETKKWHQSITQGAGVPQNHRDEAGKYRWTRQEERVMAQIRSNRSPITRAYLHVVQTCRAQSLARAQDRQRANRGRARGRARDTGRGRARSGPPPPTIAVTEPTCPDCNGADETCKHLLECPAWEDARLRIFGCKKLTPTVLTQEVEKVLAYLREMARLKTSRPDPL